MRFGAINVRYDRAAKVPWVHALLADALEYREEPLLEFGRCRGEEDALVPEDLASIQGTPSKHVWQ